MALVLLCALTAQAAMAVEEVVSSESDSESSDPSQDHEAEGTQPIEASGTPDETATETSKAPWAEGVGSQAQAQALRLFQNGNEFLEERKFEEARQLYLAALEAWSHPAIHFNLVICEVHLNHTLSAHEHIEDALAFGAAPLGSVLYDRALTYQMLLQGQVARLVVSTRHNKIEIRLDGELLLNGAGSTRKVLLPGKHQLIARKEGYVTFTEELTLVPGKPHDVTIKMISLIDATEYHKPMATWVPWSVVGVGALTTLAGVVLKTSAKAKYNDYETWLEETCTGGCYKGEQAPDLEMQTSAREGAPKKRRARAWDVASLATMSAGGAVLLTGVTLMILNSPRPVRPLDRVDSAMGMTFRPYIGKGGGGGDLKVKF